MTGRLVVLASGSGSNLQALLDATDQHRLDAEVVAVYANRRSAHALVRAAARGIPEAFVPMQPFLDEHDDPRAGREAYDRALASRIELDRPDVIVLAGWMHVFTSAFLDRFRDRVVNLHPGLPGAFPGAHAIDDAWAAHEAGAVHETGVMVHLVPDEGIDDGPVLKQRAVEIRDDDTRATLEARIHVVEHELLVEAVADLLTI